MGCGGSTANQEPLKVASSHLNDQIIENNQG